MIRHLPNLLSALRLLAAPRLALGTAWVWLLFAILSAAAYAGLFLRRLFAGRPVAS
jgi:hypothetical protein